MIKAQENILRFLKDHGGIAKRGRIWEMFGKQDLKILRDLKYVRVTISTYKGKRVVILKQKGRDYLQKAGA